MKKELPQMPSEAPEIAHHIPLDERLMLLESSLTFTTISHSILNKIASLMEEVFIPAGKVVVAEGETADRLFLIATGQAEVWITQADKQVLLATLQRGELFGEMGLLAPSGKRQATVIAATNLRVLCFTREQLDQLAREYPHILQSLEAIADFRMKVDLIKRYSPFSPLPPDRLAHLVTKLDTVHIEAGDTIIQEGESGNACYLLRRGKMEVEVRESGGNQRKVATLYPGCILGEAALLTDQPRNATVRATEPCELMTIRRADLVDALKEETQVQQQLIDLVQLRDRPQCIDGVSVHEQTTIDGDIFRILKHPLSGAYVRLSPEAWFIWERLDGQHTIKDLALKFLAEYTLLMPTKIASIIADLARSEFVKTKAIRPDIGQTAPALSRHHRYLITARRILEWRLTLKGADAFLEWIYHWGGRFAFTKPGQVILGIIAACGLIAYFMVMDSVQPIVKNPVQSLLLLGFLAPATFISLLLHEVAHGLTTKHYDRKVRGAGIGWYWFGPIAFVDVTDMWTASRWPRIAVSLAGPYTFLLLASAASLGALLSQSLIMAAALWQFAMVSYFNVARNLNPLFEYDGYFILSDFLDKPNLRTQCLGWIGRHLLSNLKKPSVLRQHWGDLMYGFLSIAFVGLMAFFAVSTYQAVFESILIPILPAIVSTVLPWAIGAITVIAGAIGVIGDMRGSV